MSIFDRRLPRRGVLAGAAVLLVGCGTAEAAGRKPHPRRTPTPTPTADPSLAEVGFGLAPFGAAPFGG